MKPYLETVRETKDFLHEMGKWSLEVIYSEDKVAADAAKIINRKTHQEWDKLDRLEREMSV
jgi:hypothetical protein|tara:strand:- start:105 stop:287 length:183 start_codon:yes stop_codon:yes gene_type:complete